MKATYSKPRTENINMLHEAYLMADSKQSPWADAKENPWGIQVWEDDNDDTPAGYDPWTGWEE